MNQDVLLVEDDDSIADVLALHLAAEGYACTVKPMAWMQSGFWTGAAGTLCCWI